MPPAAVSRIRFVLADATAPSPDFTVISGEWWPSVLLPGAASPFDLVSPEAANEDSVPDPLALSGTSNARRRNPRVRASLPVGPRADNSDACAILVTGPAADGHYDMKNMRTFLVGSGLVPAGNVFTTSMLMPGAMVDRSVTRNGLRALVAMAVDSGCKKVYLHIASHGARSAAGAVLRGTGGAATDTVSYPDFIEILKPRGLNLCIILDACYSGQLNQWMQNQGFTGIVVSAADNSHTSGFYPEQGGIFTNNFLAVCMGARDRRAIWGD